MFRFVPVETIKKTIQIEVPGHYGKTTKADFDVEFRRLGHSEAKNLIEKIREKKADEDQVLRDNIVDIDGIKDADGNDIPFSAELLTQLLDEAYIRAPLIAGFMEVTYQLDKLKRKNSKG